MNILKASFKHPTAVVHDTENVCELSYGPKSPLNGRSLGEATQTRRESQFRAVADTMNTSIAGHFIRTWSAYFCITLAIHLALYMGIAKQDLRKNLYIANSSLANFALLYVTLTAYVLPLICRFFLKILAASIAGALLSEQAYSVASACVLLAIHLQITPDLRQNFLVFRRTEKGMRGILIIRLVSDYIIHLVVPFVVLSLRVRSTNNQCWMGFDWSWLLLAFLWPSTWSIAAILYMSKYWRSQECIRSTALSTTPQVARDMKWVIRSEEDGLAKGKWRLGYRAMQGHESATIDQSYLGLVREEECISMTDMLLAMEAEHDTFGDRLPHDV